MLQSIKKWWNKDKDALNERLQQQEILLNTVVENMTAELNEANTELNAFRVKEQADQDKYTSTEPWVEIKSDTVDPIHGIQIKLDWNPAFVQYLKDNGITGKDEDKDKLVMQRHIISEYKENQLLYSMRNPRKTWIGMFRDLFN